MTLYPFFLHAWFCRRRFVRLLAAVGAVMATGRADERARPDVAQGVVMMSPFEVSANRFDFIGWQTYRSPHFVVYSDGGEKTVRPLLREMEMLHLASEALWGQPAPRRAPVVVVLPASSSDWRKLRSRGAVRWQVEVSTFGRFAYCLVAEYDWEREGAQTLWAALAGLEANWIGPEPSFAVSKGVSSYFETATFRENTVTVGEYNSRVRVLQDLGWMQWSRFFAITSESPEYVRDGPDLRRFMAQSALWVQYLLDPAAPERRKNLRQWNAVFAAGWRPPETLFQSLFGLDYSALKTTLWERTLTGRGAPRRFTFSAEELAFEITVEAAKTKAMRELFVLIQILNQRVEASEEALDSLLGKGLETAALRPLLVEACLNWKRPEAAATLLDELIAEGDATPESYAMAAGLRLERSLGAALAINGRLSAEDTSLIQSWCEQALAMEPRLVQANEVSAVAVGWGASVSPVGIQTLTRRFERLRENGRLDWCLAALAMTQWRLGDEREARKVSEYLLQSLAVRAPVKVVARDLLAQLPEQAEVPSIETEADAAAGSGG